MNDTRTLAHRAIWPAAPEAVPRWHPRLPSLSATLAAWAERIRFRWELEQKSNANPHLIDDIGLTRRQVEAEIAKPFWQA